MQKIYGKVRKYLKIICFFEFCYYLCGANSTVGVHLKNSQGHTNYLSTPIVKKILINLTSRREAICEDALPLLFLCLF